MAFKYSFPIQKYQRNKILSHSVYVHWCDVIALIFIIDSFDTYTYRNKEKEYHV